MSAFIQNYLEKMINIQNNLLTYIEEESEFDEKFQILTNLFDEQKIHDNPHDLMSLLHLLVKISNNHHRNPNFFIKIEKILQFFQDDIQKYFSNSEIFNIFKSNKRILLFLIEQKILIFDEYVVKNIIKYKYVKEKYPHYFAPEIRPFINEKWFLVSDMSINDLESEENSYRPNKYQDTLLKITKKLIDEISGDLPDNFYENRKIGENSSFICTLIRNDSIDEFIIYTNQNLISINFEINPSIYETNAFFIKNKVEDLSLINYAAFCGSLQIFNYLKINGAKLTPLSWFFAIHGQNANIIQSLNGDNIKPESYKKCYIESIKCHHNNIANYIQFNYFQKDEENSNDIFAQNLKSYNFKFIQKELINEKTFNDLCKYGYCSIASFYLKEKDININEINMKKFA